MVRICIARNGYYYVQRYRFGNWSRVGGFFFRRRDALNWAHSVKGGCSTTPRVIEYV